MAANFKRIGCGGGVQRFQRNDRPDVWVTHYPRMGHRPGCFYVYRAVQSVPAGRLPWTVDNRRQDKHLPQPFTSLRPALAFAEALS